MTSTGWHVPSYSELSSSQTPSASYKAATCSWYFRGSQNDSNLLGRAKWL